MKKVLYLTNIETPYRVRFFNELTNYCELTVLYERKMSKNRNEKWAKSEEKRHHAKFLHGIKIGNESVFSLGIIKEILTAYDSIIVGCYNSPVQMLAILVMRLLKIPYILNLDGEPFLKGNGIKSRLKRFFLSGADKYLVAGECAAQSLLPIAGDKKVIPYYFSSLYDQELEVHRLASERCERDKTILVIGQYFDYKGMDVALETARLDQSLQYKFVGMGSRTELFLKDFAGQIPDNVEIVPFLQKEDLEKEYLRCAMLLLPSRQECWGLVVNEAASFGTPIVSTWGSGAAVEFLTDRYDQYLAKPGDAEELCRCLQLLRNSDDKAAYSEYLMEKSREYTLEKSVHSHVKVLGQ